MALQIIRNDITKVSTSTPAFAQDMKRLSVRRAVAEDLNRIMYIYSSAQEFMIASGNPTQWGHFYPDEDLIRDDIEKAICFLAYENNEIHGVAALCEGDEPSYQYIENGEWLNNDKYVTVHRIAGDGAVHGVFDCIIDYCKGKYDNIRIDTHNDNKVMQHLIEKSGFQKCGTIYVFDGTPRIAYQWTEDRNGSSVRR